VSVVLELAADVVEDAHEQPGDLHLGHPDLVPDLVLRPVLEEAQVEDAPVAFG
jgi:hypothetical protein